MSNDLIFKLHSVILDDIVSSPKQGGDHGLLRIARFSHACRLRGCEQGIMTIGLG